MPEIYVSPDVADIKALHGDLSDPAFRALPMVDQCAQQAQTLLNAHGRGDRRVLFQIKSWWPGAAHRRDDDIMRESFNAGDARLTLAREYGFDCWADVEGSDPATLDLPFETALDALLDGDTAALAQRLADAPDLTRRRSRFGHRSTLLHYLGANGVESWRQQTPLNAPDLARVLIEKGADRAATANMYGGGQTAFDLAVTSAHPHAAGVAEALAQALRPTPS